MKKSKLKLLLLVFLFTFSFAKDSIVNIDQISKEAKEQKKDVLIFFHMTYCPYCVRMIDNTFSDKVAKKKMEKDFIFVDVNIDDKDKISYKEFKGSKKEFSKKLSISFYPTVVFIDGSNEIVYALKGYRGIDTFNHVLDYIKTKAYLQTDFAGFLDDMEFSKN